MRPRTAGSFALFALFAASSALAQEPSARELYEKCAPSVVMVTSTETIPRGFARRAVNLVNPFPLEDTIGDALDLVFYPLGILLSGGPLKAIGSGVIIDADGRFITNHHVIEDADVFWATLFDGRVIRAKLIGSDADEDYALLQLELEKGESVSPAPLGKSADLRPGDPVFAIGNPLCYRHTLSLGVVSGVERRVSGPFQDFIQTDLTIGAGSSGGPLWNTRGEVVGLTTLIYAAFEITGGISFSVPIDSIKEGLGQLEKDGELTRGYIGAVLKDVTPRLTKELKLAVKSGACVTDAEAGVFFGKPAKEAGLQRGDVIVKYGELKVDRARTLARAVLNTTPGTQVDVEFYRGESLHKTTITVRRR